MLYVNNPEALVAIAEEGRRELGMRSTAAPDYLPPGMVTRESTRPRPVSHLFRTRVAVAG